MAKRYDLITELYGRAIRDITEKPENWMAFLRSACRNFRLPFDEQVLVYVQRPDAVAVLEMEGWRNKFGRWVKRDSKGIAVFDKQAPAMRLKYYFDVSDTREGRYKRLLRDVPLWEMEDADREAVQETLANTFGVEESGGFEETILEAAKNAAEDNLPDYMRSLLSDRKDSLLEELDEGNVEVEAKSLLAASVSYMVMARCGIQAEAYLDAGDFDRIRDFNTPPLINSLGTAISDVAEMALSPISDTIWQSRTGRKSRDRTFEGQRNQSYTKNAKANPDTERGPEYDKSQLQQAGGLSPAGHYRTERTGGSPWEIRIPEKEIPSGRTVRDIHHPADTGEAEPAPDGNAGVGTGTDGADRERDGRGTERDGGTQGGRPDDVGGDDEQYPAGSGGDRDSGTGLQLVWYDRRKEDKKIPFFGRDSDIKALLLATPHLKATKEEICSFYETHEDRTERTEYIKSIFNNEVTEVTLEDGRSVGYKTFQNVLHLWEGSYQSRTAQGYYDWGVIAGYFEGMRLLGELWDRWRPLPTVEGQLRMLDDMAGEGTPAFSFTQEIIDYTLAKGSGIQHGKYRIYSYFLQEHSAKEKADFLKNEYGTGGHSPILTGTGIREEHDTKGLKLHRGYGDDAPELLLTWGKVAKRIDELIAAGRYMTKRELEYIPEYEKEILATEIYCFYFDQPEEVLRPYPEEEDYHAAVSTIRPQLDEPERVEEILHSMEGVLDNTADFARNYQSMQKAYHDLMDYKNGIYSLFTPIPPAENKISKPPVPADRQSRAEQGSVPAEKSDKAGQEPNLVEKKEEQPKPTDGMAEQEPDVSANEADLQEPLTVAERNYRTIMDLAPEVLRGEKGSVTFEAGASFMPLTIETIGKDQIAISHFFEQDGDSLADPDMEFEVNHEAKTLNARMYQQDTLRRFENVIQDGMVNEELENELNEFAEQWFTNIQRNRYRLVTEPQEKEPEQEAVTEETISQETEFISEDIPIGTEFVMDGRKFQVDSVDMETGNVSLLDVDFLKGAGFPIFRNEPVSVVRKQIREQTEEPAEVQEERQDGEKEENKTEEFLPVWEQEPQRKSRTNFFLHPEIPREKRNQYRITDDGLGQGTPKEKFRANIAAIQMLKKCEEEGRLATPDEQKCLSGYVGWGGLSDAFDETKTAWGTEYLELKTVLTPEEYEAARESTLTAFYTPPVVIRAVYRVLENMGLRSGNILEPSCASGNFIGMKPESLSDCKMYGVEIDPISGRIAGQLYQKSTIAIQGYEETDLPDSFFDVAVGNVPFGQFKVLDQRYDRHNFLIHDYFFAKTLDKIRPGGVIAFITSSGTMDKKNPAIRKYIAQRAELLGAVVIY